MRIFYFALGGTVTATAFAVLVALMPLAVPGEAIRAVQTAVCAKNYGIRWILRLTPERYAVRCDNGALFPWLAIRLQDDKSEPYPVD